jgi:hypothetical protein
MSVNSNPTASQQNMKKLPISKICSSIAGVYDDLYFQKYPRIFRKNFKLPPWYIYSGAWGKQIMKKT